MNLLKRIWYWRQRQSLHEALYHSLLRHDLEYSAAIIEELERLGGV